MSDVFYTTQARVKRSFPGDGREALTSLPAELAMDLDQQGISPYTFPAEISSSRLDSYFTHMMQSTLRNFSEASAEGVTFLDSHDARKLGIGQTYSGKYEESDGLSRTVAGIYTVPGIRFGGNHSFASTDDFILAVRSGLVRDVSVGFYGGKHVCDLCGSDYYSYDCPHIAGFEYEKTDDEGNAQRILATVAIHDARLSEVSAVYDGATPGAMILKAQRMLDSGDMDEMQRQAFEHRFRVALKDAPFKVLFNSTANAANFTLSHGRAAEEQDVMEQDEILTDEQEVEQENGVAEEEVEAIAEAEAEVEVDETLAAESAEEEGRAVAVDAARAESADLRKQLADAKAEMARLQNRINELAPLADAGRAYRTDLIDAALSEGVRAMGDAFPAETYQAMLDTASLEAIKTIRDGFAEQARKRFPARRQIADASVEEDAGQSASHSPRVPDVAYAG